MKILHAADLHLDTPFTGHSEEAVSYLKNALLKLPETLARLCRAHGCDLMLLSGDLFDGPASLESIQALKDALQDAAVPVFIAPGNHDHCQPDSPYLTEIWPENVHIFTRPVMESVALEGLDCRIYGAGYQSMDCGALLENFRAEGNETYHLGVLHGDAVLRNSPYCPVSQTQVANSGLDYLALGHVHKAGSYQAGQSLCAWPGCPMGRGYDETGEKGVYLIDLEDTARITFLPLDFPKFFDLEAEVVDTPENAISPLLPPLESLDFYRIALIGEAEPFSPAALSFPGFPHLQIIDRTVPPTDLWAGIGDDSLEGILFRLLHDAYEHGEENAQEAAKICRRILDGREVSLP